MSEHLGAEYIGMKITDVEMAPPKRGWADRLYIAFENGKKISLRDDGQTCCENRYMQTDDDLKSLVGHKLMRIESREVQEDDEYGTHEICFVEIGTDASFVTLANHNEHNGYYGGFLLRIEEEASA